MHSEDYQLQDHQKWLGYLQPEGLVVSPQVLVDSQVFVNRNSAPLQQRFREFLDDQGRIADLRGLLTGFFGWPEALLLGTEKAGPIPEDLKIPLKEYGEILEPTYALREKSGNILLLVKEIEGTFDDRDDSQWEVSPSQRFERLLRDCQVPIGLLANREALRLIYAPRGENSGTLTFEVSAMLETAGRPIVAALDELLRVARLLSVPTEVRLPALLAKSREYQTRVSEQLAEQVLEALFELVRGFQSADEKARGTLLRDTLEKNPDHIYEGLLNVLLRLVFILFAEDRALLPTSALYTQNYSVHGLFTRLREDHQTYPDTMDQRFGAWSQLLALFRAIHQGCKHPELKIQAREGYLFDPDRFPFLEGRTMPEQSIPLVPDGTIFRALRNLLLLDGERLSYRTLDVEHIGSVYQTMMGFKLERATGPTISLRAAKRHGAPAAVDLQELLGVKPGDRAGWLQKNADTKLPAKAAAEVKTAASIDDLLVALEKRIARGVTPHPVTEGAMILQPSQERRRSGSHYTPRVLTAPIVRKTLEPIFQRLGPNPTPQQILELKMCDMAVGSGAFLVEACRQLGDALVAAWLHHGGKPVIPADEDELLHARRLVAQRCLYGVDRNPMATDLAKLSLWLATLAKDHPFTFLDHSLRSGDALVGLSKKQIVSFHWDLSAPEAKERQFGQQELEKAIERATSYRREILEGGDYMLPALKAQRLALADEALDKIRRAGDLCVAAFFDGDKPKARAALRERYLDALLEAGKGFQPEKIKAVNQLVAQLRGGKPHPVTPFHWEIEFPEVFARENGGFDAFIGNPPYGGKNTVIEGNQKSYPDWLKTLHAESHGNADLVAHFFRRAFNLLRRDGSFGLIATNTIRQGDTRHTGLRWICVNGGTIYAARRRYKWVGAAAVVVSVVWVTKGKLAAPFDLDGQSVSVITAYLFHDGGHENPATLEANAGKSFIGSYLLGMGFTFDDTDKKGVASSLAEMERLIAKDPRNAERIFPYIGGEELNDSPDHAHNRYSISFSDFPLRREAALGRKWFTSDDNQRAAWLRTGIVPEDYLDPVAADWPDLLAVIEERVKPERTRKKPDGTFALRDPLPQRWWHYAEKRPALNTTLARVERTILRSRIGNAFAFTFLPSRVVMNEKTVVFPFETFAPFAVLQSRVHELWAVFFSTTLKDDLQYTPSDCFETFPFPKAWETDAALEAAGREYYEFRAELMVRHDEGLTKTYNRFHDPEETDPGILRLRELHAAMDRAVLTAYGWTDIPTDCEFLLDYEDEDDDEGTSRKKKKPWRYRWPDPIRDEVLARLLKLNAERAEEERVLGIAEATAKKSKAPRSSKRKSQRTAKRPDNAAQQKLF